MCFLQKKRRLPDVNRDLAATLLKEEDGEEEKKSAEDEEAAKKASKKKKPGLSDENFTDGRFSAMFENQVLTIILLRLLSVFCCSISLWIKLILVSFLFRTTKSIRNHMNMVSCTLLLLLRSNLLW